MASSFLGGTLYRYAIYIGIYMCTMGVGSLYFNFIKSEKKTYTFLWLEIILVSLATVLPAQLVYLNNYLSPDIFEMTIYTNTAIIGFISGIELPLLLSIFHLEEETNNFLFIDYLGMFIGSILFAIILFPYLGVFGAIWSASLINLVMLIFFIVNKIEIKKQKLIALLLVMLMLSFNFSLLLNTETFLEKLQLEYVK